MGLTGGENPVTGRLVELGHKIPTAWADPPPAAAFEGLGRGHQLHGVVMLRGLASPVVRGGVGQANPAALLAHVSLVADAGPLLPSVSVGPRERAAHGGARPERAVADEVVEIELQRILDRGPSAVITAARSAHVVS
jgi:hypothetical protein